MYIKEYLDSKNVGVSNLENRVTPERLAAFEKRNQMLEAGMGSRPGCFRTLSSDCEVRAMLAYFRDGDIFPMKRWAYLSSKTSIMLEHETNEVIGIEYLLWPLISDNEEVIDWHCANPMFYESLDDPQAKERINSHEFARLQVQRAMTRQWDALAVDCERALAEPEAFSKTLRPRLVTFAFLLALARGDKVTMQTILLDKCTPKQRSRSYQFESGLTNNFIVSYATLYAKLAWRSGYELDLDTPWIPKEWLPVKPLDKYEDPWPFMQTFDIWQPFAEPYAKYSPRRPLAGI
jgi:hypothetical protein